MICNEYALSTVAMSIYNYLAAYGPLNFDKLLHLVNQQHPGIKVEQMKEAILELKNRCWITGNTEVLELLDLDRRPVVGRNREDWSINEKTGEISGGWSNWIIRDKNGELYKVEEVV